ncbi:hypothetical protein PGT21_028516 [Puccinia graminis f. sp. tritici]|uniref:Uncharacterized protein n=1 Tax=Puccinia graminis f. sp. tritici TaxID=56615 RepID=A0A5B0Q6Z1_PUCGR|nr:hypothetical protein PGT21_028516 [Puccinia graminis f. sp. tritici]
MVKIDYIYHVPSREKVIGSVGFFVFFDLMGTPRQSSNANRVTGSNDGVLLQILHLARPDISGLSLTSSGILIDLTMMRKSPCQEADLVDTLAEISDRQIFSTSIMLQSLLWSGSDS